jgi:hypothetical protein
VRTNLLERIVDDFVCDIEDTEHEHSASKRDGRSEEVLIVLEVRDVQPNDDDQQEDDQTDIGETQNAKSPLLL